MFICEILGWCTINRNKLTMLYIGLSPDANNHVTLIITIIMTNHVVHVHK